MKKDCARWSSDIFSRCDLGDKRLDNLERKKKIPAKKPSLNWAYKAIAKLAGWNDSKKTGKACWSKLWEGWYLLSHRLQGYLLIKNLLNDMYKRQGQARDDNSPW